MSDPSVRAVRMRLIERVAIALALRDAASSEAEYCKWEQQARDNGALIVPPMTSEESASRERITIARISEYGRAA